MLIGSIKNNLKVRGFILFTLFILSSIQCNEPSEDRCEGDNYYAGIEISATSIKKTLLEKGDDGTLKSFGKTKTKQLNFSDNSEIDAGELTLIIDELKSQFEHVARRCISKEHTFIAFSSGMEKIAGLDKLQEKIITELNFPAKNIEVVNYHIETISAIKTCQVTLSESEFVFFDIGGSNTKFGVYDKSSNLYLTESIPYGTRSLEERIRTEIGNIPTFEQIEDVGTSIIQKEITNQFMSNAALGGKSSILLVGGIAYNMVDNIYKTREKGKLMTLNFSEEKNNDIETYKQAIIENTVIIPDELKYNQQELYTGHLILREIVKAADIDVIYYMDQVSWMPGFIQYKISE